MGASVTKRERKQEASNVPIALFQSLFFSFARFLALSRSLDRKKKGTHRDIGTAVIEDEGGVGAREVSVLSHFV